MLRERLVPYVQTALTSFAAGVIALDTTTLDADDLLRASLRAFQATMDERRRLARLGLSELDAALADPRWQAQRAMSSPFSQVADPAGG